MIRRGLVSLLLAMATVWAAACGDRSDTTTPGGPVAASRSESASRLVVGYDREPDTLNRFSTQFSRISRPAWLRDW